MGSPDDTAAHPAGLHRLPFRGRDSHLDHSIQSLKACGNNPKDASTIRFNETCLESLHLSPLDNTHGTRIRSPTESSMSTLSSVPDSATTASIASTVATPLSPSFANDLHDFYLPGSRPVSRARHRQQSSIGTCSTFVNDEEDPPILFVEPKYHDHKSALDSLWPSPNASLSTSDEIRRPGSRDGEETLPIRRAPSRLASHSRQGSLNGSDSRHLFSPRSEAPPIKEEDEEEGEQRVPLLTFDEESPPCETPHPGKEILVETRPNSAFDRSAPADDVAPEHDASPVDDTSPEDEDAILDYALQLAYGMDIHDAPVAPAVARRAVRRFIRDLGQAVRSTAGPGAYGNINTAANTCGSSTSASSTPGGTSSNGESQRGGKRKKKQSGGGDDDSENFTDGDGSGDGNNTLPQKRARPNPREEEALRLSCPFRKRNPRRFNVRDHHSCAMTFFPKFAELRQHIVKHHKRDDPSAFLCGRCNRDFATRRELHHHQRLPREQMCEISDHDPESGVDGATSTKLLSRKRASGTSPEVQWREVWNILFPEDDDHLVPPYQFTPVIEHFELSTSYLASFDYLRASLRDKMSNPATLETLATKFHQCFVEAVDRCIADVQSMPYANRSNKRSEQLAAAASASTSAAALSAAQQRKDIKDVVMSRPDSGVAFTDDGSDESGSVVGVAGGGSVAPSQAVKTIVGPHHPGNNLQSSTRMRDIAPAAVAPASSASFPLPPFSMPLSQSSSAPTPVTVSSGPVAPTDVQAWSQSVMFPGTGGSGSGSQGMISQGNFGIHPQDLSLQHNQQQDLGAWGQTSFYDAGSSGSGMEDGFNFF